MYVHIFMFTYCQNNHFQKKSVGQNTNIWIYTPAIIGLATALVLKFFLKLICHCLKLINLFCGCLYIVSLLSLYSVTVQNWKWCLHFANDHVVLKFSWNLFGIVWNWLTCFEIVFQLFKYSINCTVLNWCYGGEWFVSSGCIYEL